MVIDPNILLVISTLVTFLLGYVVKMVLYGNFKLGLADLRVLFDDMDDAMKDNQVTEAEAQKIWDDFYKIYNDFFQKNAAPPVTLKK